MKSIIFAPLIAIPLALASYIASTKISIEMGWVASISLEVEEEKATKTTAGGTSLSVMGNSSSERIAENKVRRECIKEEVEQKRKECSS